MLPNIYFYFNGGHCDYTAVVSTVFLSRLEVTPFWLELEEVASKV